MLKNSKVKLSSVTPVKKRPNERIFASSHPQLFRSGLIIPAAKVQDTVNHQPKHFFLDRHFVASRLNPSPVYAYVDLPIDATGVGKIKRYDVGPVIMAQEFPVDSEQVFIIDKHKVDTVGSLLFFFQYATDKSGETYAVEFRRTRIINEKIYFHLMLVSARESAMLLSMTSGPIRVKSPDRALLSTFA